MKILFVHNYYKIRGGEEECYEAEANLLIERGHDVHLYEERNDNIAEMSGLDLAIRTIWSRKSYKDIRQLVNQNHYDIIHVHNFFPLISPSIYYVAKEANIPVVQTLHNYRLVCPSGLLFRNGKACEACISKPFPLPGIVYGCYRESRIATGVVATMLSLHRVAGTWNHHVDKYIALTEFARQKFVDGGINERNILLKPHFISPDPGIGRGDGNFALFVGRISIEKGLDVLLEAWEKISSRLPLKIVGDGPLSQWVQAQSKSLPNVHYLGRKPLQDVYKLMGEASMQIIPSKWYETFGRIAIEAYAKGTPVMAANIGAIAELVKPGITGWHFRAGDPDDLVKQVNQVLDHPETLPDMRCAARAEFEENYTAERNYQRQIEIYQGVLLNRK